jgi:predicted AAA+ superfamily ATPase
MFLRNPLFFRDIRRIDTTIPLIVLDEIHKFKDWKNYMKGVHDQFGHEYRFLVSGSGRLDVYQRGGDSLAGRYEQFHLWPLTLAELSGKTVNVEGFLRSPFVLYPEPATMEKTWNDLLVLSGFPEPFVSGNQNQWRRWSENYGRQLIREDIRDLAGVQAVQELEMLYAILPDRVGSPLSLNALAIDLKVAYNTVKAWMEVMERFFLIFRLPPFTGNIARAIQKEKKLYLFNVPIVRNEGARFENAVALELFRAVSNWNDIGIGPFTLNYLRNKEKQEVDFVLCSQGKPVLLVEAKLSDDRPSDALMKFQRILDVPAVQLLHRYSGYREIPNGERKLLVAPAWQWLSGLP